MFPAATTAGRRHGRKATRRAGSTAEARLLQEIAKLGPSARQMERARIAKEARQWKAPNPMKKKRKARKKRQPAGLARYWAKKRKKKNSRKRRNSTTAQRQKRKMARWKKSVRKKAPGAYRSAVYQRAARRKRRNSPKLPKHVHLPITLSKKQRSKLARALSAITGKRVHVQ